MSFRIKSSNKIPFETAPAKPANTYMDTFKNFDGQNKLTNMSSTTQTISTPRSSSSGGMAIRSTRSIESDVR
jgi:hypothetical protein